MFFSRYGKFEFSVCIESVVFIYPLFFFKRCLWLELSQFLQFSQLQRLVVYWFLDKKKRECGRLKINVMVNLPAFWDFSHRQLHSLKSCLFLEAYYVVVVICFNFYLYFCCCFFCSFCFYRQCRWQMDRKNWCKA